MIKFKQGDIQNMEGVTKDIIVKAKLPNNARDIVIGSVLVGLGITYLTVTAFKNGSKHFEMAEYKTMVDLGIITE